MKQATNNRSRLAARLLPILILLSGTCFAGLKEGLADFDRGAFPSALATLQPLAEKGDVSAQYTVGIANYQGLGTSQDYALAMKWFSRAAAQDLPPAEYCVGVMLAHGEGVHANPTAAIAWYKRAVAHGYGPAFHNLAVQYGEGRGVSQDMAIALGYFMVSAERGVAQDAATRDMLLLNLKPDKVAAARAHARTLREGIKPVKLPPLPNLGTPGAATPAP
jgi:TPR repeat protein